MQSTPLSNYYWSGVKGTEKKKWIRSRKHIQVRDGRREVTKSRSDLHIALDAEFVGVGPEGIDSALARVSLVNFENRIIFHTYVRVEEPITDYRHFVSGILPEQIQSDSAMPLSTVRHIISSILHGKVLIGHGLESDLKVIGIQHPLCDIRDTATYEPFMRIERSKIDTDQHIYYPRKLKDLTKQFLGRDIQDYGKPHSPIEDAIASMDLYRSVRYLWEESVAEKMRRNISVQTAPMMKVKKRNNYYPNILHHTEDVHSNYDHSQPIPSIHNGTTYYNNENLNICNLQHKHSNYFHSQPIRNIHNGTTYYNNEKLNIYNLQHKH